MLYVLRDMFCKQIIDFTQIFIAAASILASFNVSKAMGADGKLIEPEVKFTVHQIR